MTARTRRTLLISVGLGMMILGAGMVVTAAAQMVWAIWEFLT